MELKRIAIACQSGGSQCAFVAGALKTLLADGVHHRYEIVGLSGTSGGAITAALAWVGLLRQAQGDPAPVSDRILACWEDLTAKSPPEIMLDGACIQLFRLIENGFLPGVVSSPASVPFQLWSTMASSLIAREEFTDLRAVLEKHLALDSISSLMRPDSTVLLVGAADVLEGGFKIFSSARDEIRTDALLASAAAPSSFSAAQVDRSAYWDGSSASNPPLTAFLRKAYMGTVALPEEIWVIQVNPARLDAVPLRPSDISDRRDQLAGNASLQHELRTLEMVNLLLQERAMTERFRARFGLDITAPVRVRFIQMSDELLQQLDYPSKLSRQPGYISRLITEGEAQALSFLEELADADRPRERTFSAASAATHESVIL